MAVVIYWEGRGGIINSKNAISSMYWAVHLYRPSSSELSWGLMAVVIRGAAGGGEVGASEYLCSLDVTKANAVACTAPFHSALLRVLMAEVICGRAGQPPPTSR